jgi:hypothetical protein
MKRRSLDRRASASPRLAPLRGCWPAGSARCARPAIGVAGRAQTRYGVVLPSNTVNASLTRLPSGLISGWSEMLTYCTCERPPSPSE